MRTYTSEKHIGVGKTVGIHRMKGNPNQVLHRHEFIELVYILEGTAVEWVDEACYNVKKGDALFINYGSTHAFTSDSGFTHVEIFFSPALVEQGVITADNALTLLSLAAFDKMRKEQNGGKISFHGEDREEVEFILRAMLKEYESNRVDTNAVMENYLNILLTKMRRADEGSDADGIMKDIWQVLKDYIDENPESDLSLSALASKCFYNPSYFSRTFKKKFGTSPTEYIRTKRIERAKTLLREEDTPVEVIISRVGFSDRSSFYHAFAAQTGMTPAEYRNEGRKK